MTWVRPIAAFVAVVALSSLALSGCADSGAIERVQGSWVLVAGQDARGEFIESARPVTLAIEGDAFSGASPCNTYGGVVRAESNGLRFGAIASTEMACADPEQMSLEGRYVAGLGAVTAGSVIDGELVLRGGGVQLRYRDDATG